MVGRYGWIRFPNAVQERYATVRPVCRESEQSECTSSSFFGRPLHLGDKPFSFKIEGGNLHLFSDYESLEPVLAGNTLKDAYMAASTKHFLLPDSYRILCSFQCRNTTPGLN